MDMTHNNKKGFTLIELLIVIGILAILATAVILILNPAELFRQARDSQRISDMATMKSALAFYLSTVTGGTLQASGKSAAVCYAYQPVGVTIPPLCAGRHATTGPGAITEMVAGAGLLADGTGWIPVDFGQVPGGSPLSVLPRDPRASTGSFYSYVGNTVAGTFEMNADMESTRYANGGNDDVESVDGGDKADLYEVGNDPGLNL